MNQKLKKYEGIGFLFTALLGTLMHFVYEWSGNNPLVGLFAPVNESTWEHLKLLFFPYLIYSIIEYFLLCKDVEALNDSSVTNYSCYENFWTAKFLGVLAGLLFIPVFFYTYSGILGRNYLVLDIITFFLAVFIAYYVDYKVLQKESPEFGRLSLLLLLGLMLCFFIFTIFPPSIGLFLPPS